MLTDITLGQYYPGNSCIHRLDPRTKILAVLFYMVMVFLANSPLSYGILIGFIVLGAALAKLPAGLLLRSIKPLWIIILLTMVIHFVTDPGEALWHWKFITVTREGIVLGVKMSLRLVLLLLVSSLMTFTTSPIVLTDGIESLLRPFMKRAKNMLPILIPLFISSFRRADELALAMEARCYRGGEGRTRMHELVYGKADALTGLVMLALFVLLAFLRWGIPA